MLKMDVETVIYRYFAESARCLKKIQHSIRSGEAELRVVSDGEEPRPEDLKAAFDEYLVTVKKFGFWTKKGREEAETNLVERFDKQESDDRRTNMVVAGSAACGAGGAEILFGPVAAGACALVGAGVAILPKLPSLCGEPRKTSRDVVMSSWHETQKAEMEIVAFLPSLSQSFQNLSFKEALQKAEEFRSELDRFLQLLQTEGLIFDPCSMFSGFQRTSGYAF